MVTRAREAGEEGSTSPLSQNYARRKPSRQTGRGRQQSWTSLVSGGQGQTGPEERPYFPSLNFLTFLYHGNDAFIMRKHSIYVLKIEHAPSSQEAPGSLAAASSARPGAASPGRLPAPWCGPLPRAHLSCVFGAPHAM